MNEKEKQKLREVLEQHDLKIINPKLDSLLKEVAKHIRAELDGKITNDCSTAQNMARRFREIGIFDDRNYVSYPSYDSLDLSNDD